MNLKRNITGAVCVLLFASAVCFANCRPGKRVLFSHESFKANQRKAFHGMALAIVQSKLRPGRIVLKATSAGLESALVVINAR